MTPESLPRPDGLDAMDQVYFESPWAGRRFQNPWDAPPLPGPGALLKWQTTRNPHRSRKRQKVRLPVVQSPLEALAAMDGPTRVLWIGHASFLIETAGARILIDPVFGRAGGLVPRVTRSALKAADLPKIDAVLLTHGHHDHLDRASLAALGRRFGDHTIFAVPQGLAKVLPRACKRRVELSWWQRIPLGDAMATFVPAQHWHRRGLADENRALWGAWVVEGDHRVYHSGDTGYFDGFRAIGQTLGAPDVAILPLGAYEPRWFMGSQHMPPEDSVRAFEDLGARHFVGMHWGTFDLSDEPVDAGPELLTEIISERALDPRRFTVLHHGGAVALNGADVAANFTHPLTA